MLRATMGWIALLACVVMAGACSTQPGADDPGKDTNELAGEVDQDADEAVEGDDVAVADDGITDHKEVALPDTEVDVAAEEIESPEGTDEDVTPADAAEVDACDPETGCGTDILGDQVEVQGICPCNSVFQPVCGLDNKTQYDNLDCAQCAVCSNCPGCPDTNPTFCGGGTSDYMLYKGLCGHPDCTNAAKCTAISFPQCTGVCGYEADAGGNPLSTTVTYAGLCDLIWAFKAQGWLDNSWKKWIVDYSPCAGDVCDACIGQPSDPICGTDGLTYDSVCAVKSCPKTANADFLYSGKCLGPTFCNQCASQTKDAVCANETASNPGTTYANACAAKCDGVADAKVRAGKCCPECDVGEPACGADGKIYLSSCHLTECLGKEPCPDTGAGVCGKNGQNYPNECQATCFAAGTLHTGDCLGPCEQCGTHPTLDPVCGKIGVSTRSFQNQCFATCYGATVTGAGQCSSCTTLCGTIAAPKNDGSYAVNVCAEDGVSYPTSCFPQNCYGGISFNACP